MSRCSELRKEFHCSYFGWKYDAPKDFVVSQCGPTLLYPIWTGIWLLWHLSWFAVDPYNAYKDGGTGNKYYFIYLTNWGYIFVGCSSLVDFITTLFVHMKRKDILHERNKTDGQQVTPWYLKLNWFLFEFSSVVAVLVTIAYYGLLSPNTEPSSIAKHGLNSVYVILTLFVCAKPIRILHVIYPVIFGILYCTFSVIYQKGGDGAPIYPVLDWDNPDKTIVYTIVLVLVGVPVVHITLFAIHKLRIFINENCCNRRVQFDNSDFKTDTETEMKGV